jgi:diketogulonate reductase-like aldo/keto reductase
VIDAYCKKNGIIVEAYSPIVRNYKASDPTLVDLAKKYEKSTQQVLIRYALQKEWVPLPKTDNPDRIIANANVFDFDISAEDMAVLDGLDQGSSGAIVEAVVNE